MKQGNMDGLSGSGLDMTGREEHSLDHSERVYSDDPSKLLAIVPVSSSVEYLLRSLGDFFLNGKHGILLTDQAGKILAWNPALTTLTGWTSEQMIGKSLWEMQYTLAPNEARRPGFMENLRERDFEYLTQHAWPPDWQFKEMRVQRPDGSMVRIRTTVLRFETGSGKYLLGISHEIPSEEPGKKLRISEAKCRGMFETLQAGIIVLNAEGECIEANQSACDLFGLTSEQMRDRSHHEFMNDIIREDGSFLSKNEYPGVIAARTGTRERGVVLGYNRPNGQSRWGMVTAAPIIDHETGVRLGAITTIMDITDRKRTEDEKARLAAIVESSTDAIMICSLDGIVTNWNEGAERIFGYSAVEMIGRSIKTIAPADLQHEVQSNIDTINRGERILPCEGKRCRKDGGEIWISYTAAPVKNSRGETIGIASISRDITKRKRIHREHARLAAIVESSCDAIMCGTLDGIVTAWNHGAELLYEVSAEEIIGKPFTLIVPEERHQIIWDHLRAATRKEQSTYETKRSRKDGTEFFVEYISSPVFDSAGNVIAVSTIARDITARKLAEEASARLVAIVETSNDAIMCGTVDGIVTAWNHAAELMYEMSAEEIVGKPFDLVVPEQHRDLIRKHLEAAGRKENMSLEVKRTRKDGTEYYAAYTTSPVLDSAGNVIGASAIVRDVTVKKRAEEVRTRLAAIVEASNDAIFSTDLDRVVTTWNRGAELMFGYTATEMVGSSITTIIPDDRLQEIVGLSRTIERGRSVSALETKRLRKDGSSFYASITLSPLRNHNDEIIGVSAIIHDIDQRKRAEEERSKLAAIVECSDDAIFGGDLEGYFTDWNHAAELLTGFSAKEVIGAHYDSLVSPDRVAEVGDYIAAVRRGEDLPPMEIDTFTKDGTSQCLSVRISTIKDKEGKTVGLSGIARDVSESKRTQQALKENEERFRRLADNAPDVIYRINIKPELSLEYASPALTQLIGYAPADFAADPELIFRVIHPEGMDDLRSCAGQNTIPVGPIPIKLITKSGRLVWSEHRCAPVFDADGQLMAIEGICRDVTDKMRAEQERESMLVQERALAKIGELLVSQVDIERVVQSVAHECLGDLGVDVVELYYADATRRILRLAARGSHLEPMLLDTPAQAPISFDASHVAARSASLGRIQLDTLSPHQVIGDSLLASLNAGEVSSEVVAYPLVSQHRLLGVLTFTCQRLSAFLLPGHSFGETIADLFAMEIEKAQLYQNLSARERQVELLLGRTIDAQEQERERLCQEIRDGVDHNLLEAVNLLDSLRDNPLVPSPIQTAISQASGFVQNGMVESRRVAGSLRPEALDLLGLVPTLGQELHTVASRAHIAIDFDADSLTIPKPVETAIYRIVKEAVYTIVKHGEVTKMNVSLRNQETSLTLTIEDDGFKQGSGDRETQSRAMQLALISIRKRAALLGGFVSAGSVLGKGPRLRVTIPILAEYVQAAHASSLKNATPLGLEDSTLSKISVLIVDDHVVARRGLRVLLETDELVEVIGEASDGMEAVNATGQLRPQVVLMDMKMPRMDGLEATRQIKSRFPTCSVIILTSFEDETLLINALQAGAAGYLLKGASWELLRHTIRTVATGGVLTDTNLLKKALATVGTALEDDVTRRHRQRLTEALTDRERIVLKRLTEGKTNKEIADELSFSEITVKREVQSIITKLEASDRTHAATVAIRLGLVE
jgi:PAS domain S-box-containing protein